jgi:hypothetical protein
VYGRLLCSHVLCLLRMAIHLVNCVFSGVGKAREDPAARGGGGNGEGAPNV